MKPLRIGLILAGGTGERFWPLSQPERPKQLLPLRYLVHGAREKTLLHAVVSQVRPLIPRERLYIVTSQGLRESVLQAAVGMLDDHVLIEPCKRNTAGCLVYATAHLLATLGEDHPFTLAVLTADHIVRDEERFRSAVAAALDLAEQERALVLLGIHPTRPETGFGYLEVAGLSEQGPEHPSEAFPVVRFREKPSREEVARFLASQRFLWNSGMFFCTVEALLAELAQVQPTMLRAIRAMSQAMRQGDSDEVARVFGGLESISIDYALLERASRLLVLPTHFGWDNLNGWDALDRTYPHDEDGNAISGEPLLIDTHNCIVYHTPDDTPMKVVTIGIKGLAVIVTPEGILVVPKDRVQDVRHAVRSLGVKKPASAE